MPKPRVFVTRQLPEAAMARFRTAALDIDVWPDDNPPDGASLRVRVAGVDGLLSLLTDPIDGAVMDAAGPQLRVISQMAVGYDNIDVAAARARGIAVGHTPGVLTETTADFAFALLLAAARRVVEGVDFVKAGRWTTWHPMQLTGPDVYGATLGIVGFGRIGQAMARRARGFNMRVLYGSNSRKPEAEAALNAEFRTLDDLLRESDFVSLHVPLTPETHHLIGARELALMKPTAVLVNTARGAVVNPQALHAALSSGALWAAALDVTEPEPIGRDDPLLSLPNCIVAPHLGSASIATRTTMAQMAIDNLLAGLAGTALPNAVPETR